jgi:hypothetical protein
LLSLVSLLRSVADTDKSLPGLYGSLTFGGGSFGVFWCVDILLMRTS